MTTYAVDIHMLSGDQSVQVITYHYCAGLENGFVQCATYDGIGANSSLVGIELIISNDTFASLPESEKAFWYPHSFNILNGLLVLPDVPAAQELTVLASLINTYAKSIHFWQPNSDFPSGVPKLFYGIEREDQIDESVADEMSRQLNLGTTWQERAEQRKSLIAAPPLAGCGNTDAGVTYPQFIAN